jgi:hypothetical protein
LPYDEEWWTRDRPQFVKHVIHEYFFGYTGNISCHFQRDMTYVFTQYT